MNSISKSLLIAAIIVGFFIGGLSSCIADDPAPRAPAGRAVERPDHDGPYKVGFMYESFKGSTKSYTVQVKLFYPAQGAGENTAVDSSSAPYPTVVQLTGFGGGVESLNSVATRFTTWGLVVAGLEVNWTDWPKCANVSDMNDLLTQLEADNASGPHRLAGMLDKACFGLHGYSSGGGLTVVDSAGVPRIRAAVAWAPAIDNSFSDVLAPNYVTPIQVQGGSADPDYDEHADYIYKNFKKAPRQHIQIKGANHGGPYIWDAVVSHFMRYLRNIMDYEKYLYWDEAMNDAANTTYALNFTLANGTFFPPNITVVASNTTPAEEQKVDFSLSIEGFLPAGHPRGAFKWDLESDGTVDAQGPFTMTASKAYSTAGTRYVKLWFQLGDLALNTNRTLSVTVANLAPTVSLGEDRTAVEDETLQFTAAAQDTPYDLATLNYSWSFGDGVSIPHGLAKSANHSYAKAGNYTVTLTAQDVDGATGSASIRVAVSNVAPQATAGADLTAKEDEPVSFSGAGNDTLSDRAGLSYRWDFGDGGSRDWSPDPKVLHTYVQAGNYTATLTVRDGDLATGSSTLMVRVLNEAPSSRATAPPEGSSAEKDESLDFDGSGSDTPSDLASLRFSWDFGDGNASDWSDSTKASHTYTKGGKYRAVLRVHDDDGALAEAGVNLTVKNQAPTVVIRSPAAQDAKEDERVQFTAAGDDTESDSSALTYSWVIDGMTLSGASVEVKFTTEGPKAFTVTVTDPEGAKGTATGTLNIKNIAPKVNIEVYPLKLFMGDSINFSATVTDSPSDAFSLKYSWNFGDGSTYQDKAGVHVFNKIGIYNVVLTVTDDEGLTATETIGVTVDAKSSPPPPPTPHPDDGGKGALSTSMLIGAGGAVAAIAIVGVLAFLFMRRKPKQPGADSREDTPPSQPETGPAPAAAPPSPPVQSPPPDPAAPPNQTPPAPPEAPVP